VAATPSIPFSPSFVTEKPHRPVPAGGHVAQSNSARISNLLVFETWLVSPAWAMCSRPVYSPTSALSVGGSDMNTMRILTAAIFATVFAVSTASTQTQQVSGTIDKTDGNTLYIKSAGGPVTVTLADNALIVRVENWPVNDSKMVLGWPPPTMARYWVTDKSELTRGARVAIPAATEQPDGTFTAARINVCRFGLRP
jgi:hypothetical protein